MSVFFLNPANSDFASGKGTYQSANLTKSTAVMRVLSRTSLALGLVLTLLTGTIYFIQENARDRLINSVQTTTATVSGCEGPGRFQNIRFHYEANGRTYEEPAYERSSTFTGGSGLIDACNAGAVKLQYLAGIPSRWSISPLSPITREEREQGLSAFYLVAGPTMLLIAGIFALAFFSIKKQQSRIERLVKEGVVLPAELIKAKADTSDESPYNIRCEYRFTSPRGTPLTGRTSGLRVDLKKENYPLPGTPMLVLYADDTLFDAL